MGITIPQAPSPQDVVNAGHDAAQDVAGAIVSTIVTGTTEVATEMLKVASDPAAAVQSAQHVVAALEGYATKTASAVTKSLDALLKYREDHLKLSVNPEQLLTTIAKGIAACEKVLVKDSGLIITDCTIEAECKVKLPNSTIGADAKIIVHLKNKDIVRADLT